MAKRIAIGAQYFNEIRKDNIFYVDKTNFIKEWWDSEDKVTLITRPRRFGKTLAVSMIDYFFSVKHAGKSGLFEGLSIWENKEYHKLQGTYPVIFLSFAGVKKNTYRAACNEMKKLVIREYRRHEVLLKSQNLIKFEIEDYSRTAAGSLEDDDIGSSINQLSEFLSKHYGKRVIILLDEYDTPMHEAYVNGYWDEMSDFMRGLMNAVFKTNPYMERALLTGITRISKESMFSDLNHLKTISVFSEKYEAYFGFTEDEVFKALEEYGLQEQMEKVKGWYDGFRFGNHDSIYNPWSVINFLDERKFGDYWANTGSNKLASDLIQKNSAKIKMIMEDLLQGKSFHAVIDEDIVFSQLDDNENAVWSLLLASGYLKAVSSAANGDGKLDCELMLTNLEVMHTFRGMFAGWFSCGSLTLEYFLSALQSGDLEEMNEYLNGIMLETLSSYDTGRAFSKSRRHENFYHGFVLGMLAGFRKQYIILSNRESGKGRYDVTMQARDHSGCSFIFEFKVWNSKKEKSLRDTVNAALEQIVEKKYAADLVYRGISADRIRIYGFAFSGSEVLIDGGDIRDYM